MPTAYRFEIQLRPLAVTLGDPAGIGAEVTARALAQWRERGAPTRRLVICGHCEAWRRTPSADSLVDVPVRSLADAFSVPDEPLVFVDVAERAEVAEPPPFGQATAEGGRIAAASLDCALEACLSGTAAGMVTAPINKSAMQLAGWASPDHTTWLAEATGRGVRMGFVGGGLTVVLATVHVALRAVPELLTVERVHRSIVLAHESFHRLRGSTASDASPRIAVCGLNPHAGEGGLFGDEDDRVIRPAVEQARANGLDVVGPLPGDAVFQFARTMDGEEPPKYDIVVAMYHDQGLIPVKLVARRRAVNVTLGLPFVRTSPEHGTAYDIAGTGTANADSMLEAFRLADRLCG